VTSGSTVALAVNPTSGRGRGAQAGDQAFARLASAGLSVSRLAGRDAADLAARVGRTVADGVDALVVVGGDGMVHLGVNAVAGTATPLGIVAAGTGNDIARSLGLPVEDTAAAATAVIGALTSGQQPRVRAIDAARCTRPDEPGCRWFAGVLAAGFDAIVNERANRWTRPKGHLRYDLAILRELPVFRAREYELVLDGEPWHTRGMLVAIGNGPCYGGGMRVCPDALFDDGLLDVMVVAPMSRIAFMRLYPRVYSGRHVEHPLVEVRRARRVHLACEGIVAYGDGERMHPLPMTTEAVPGALRVLAGACTP